MTPQDAAKKIIVALDSDNDAVIRRHTSELGAHVGMLKIGLQAFVAFGPAIVDEAKRFGRVFLDLKLVDIPATMAGAVRAATIHGVAMTNVYADAGEAGMRAAVQARDEAWVIRQQRFPDESQKPLLIGVTVLTSQKHSDLVKAGTLPKPNVLFGSADLRADANADAGERALRDLVVRRAVLTKESGLDGVVCSPEEIRLVREACGEGFLIVTPGVRPAWADANDQKRVMTPSEAVKVGADYLVIGRPILKPPTEVGTPEEAVKRIVKEICGESEAA